MNKDELKELIGGVVDERLAGLKESQGAFVKEMLAEQKHASATILADKTKGRGLARLIRALGASKGDPERAIKFAEKQWEDDLGERIVKALGTNVGTAAGFMVPDDMSQEVIELLRARAVVRSMNPVTLPMPNGVATIAIVPASSPDERITSS